MTTRRRRLTPPEMLETIGHALYGEGWVGILAHEFDINQRSVHRWLNGRLELTEDHGIFSEMLEALKARETYLTIPRAKKLLEGWIPT